MMVMMMMAMIRIANKMSRMAHHGKPLASVITGKETWKDALRHSRNIMELENVSNLLDKLEKYISNIQAIPGIFALDEYNPW